MAQTNLTRKELEDLEKREMFIADQQAVLLKVEKERAKAKQKGIRQGRKEGIEDGRKDGIKEVAKKLLNNGMSIEQVT